MLAHITLQLLVNGPHWLAAMTVLGSAVELTIIFVPIGFHAYGQSKASSPFAVATPSMFVFCSFSGSFSRCGDEAKRLPGGPLGTIPAASMQLAGAV